MSKALQETKDAALKQHCGDGRSTVLSPEQLSFIIHDVWNRAYRHANACETKLYKEDEAYVSLPSEVEKLSIEQNGEVWQLLLSKEDHE